MNSSLFLEDTSGSLVALISIVGFVGGVVGIVGFSGDAFVNDGKGFSRRVNLILVGACAVLLVASVSVFTIVTTAHFAASAAVRESREAFFEERGVSVPDSQWENLDFPLTKPTEDAEFGIAQATRDGEVISVRLAWEHGEMVLYGTDGQPLDVLK